MLNAILRPVTEETFTFTPEDGSGEITIRTGVLREWLLNKAMDKVGTLQFPEGETEAELIERHGLEAPRMASMTEAEAVEPVIVAESPDGKSHILIDGGHRRWFWWKRGVNTLKGWMVPHTVWQHFQMDLHDPKWMVLNPDERSGARLPQRRAKP